MRPRPWSRAAAAAALVLTFASAPAWAIRPFITDDARVVGGGMAQVETWLQIDETALAHWLLPSIGPTRWLELSVGGMHGWPRDGAHAVAGPVGQAKFLFREVEVKGAPGIAAAIGFMPPTGRGYLVPEGLSVYGYLAATFSLNYDDTWLVHVNLGVGSHGQDNGPRRALALIGAGTDFLVAGRLRVMFEAIRGDSYTPARDIAVQAGLRLVLSPHVQIDASVGRGVAGPDLRPLWGTIGLRLATGRMW